MDMDYHSHHKHHRNQMDDGLGILHTYEDRDVDKDKDVTLKL